MLIQELTEQGDGARGEITGIIRQVARRRTTRGGIVAEFLLSEPHNDIRVLMFPNRIAEFGHLIEDGKTVTVHALLDGRSDVPVVCALAIA